MAKRDEHTFDFLTGRESDFMESVMDELADTPWAEPLIDNISASGGLTRDNKAKLFELRLATVCIEPVSSLGTRPQARDNLHWTLASRPAAAISSSR